MEWVKQEDKQQAFLRVLGSLYLQVLCSAHHLWCFGVKEKQVSNEPKIQTRCLDPKEVEALHKSKVKRKALSFRLLILSIMLLLLSHFSCVRLCVTP